LPTSKRVENKKTGEGVDRGMEKGGVEYAYGQGKRGRSSERLQGGR